MVLLLALTAGLTRVASAQMDEPNLLLMSSKSRSPKPVSDATIALERDERVEKDLNHVITLDSRTLSDDQHRLHEIREAIARDTARNRTASLTADQQKSADLEQSVSVLKGCVVAERELVREDEHDIRVDRREIKLEGQG